MLYEEVLKPILNIGLLAALLTAPLAAQDLPAKDPAAQRAMLDQYCVTCHNQQLKTAGLMLDKMDLNHVSAGAQTWEKVILKLRGGMMPPQGHPRPDSARVDSFVNWLEKSIDSAPTARTDPGRSGVHRLNRTEYGNAVRDLLDLDVNVADLLPADDESDGFDNIADALKVSPSLLEQYLSASTKIAALAVGDPGTLPVSQVYQVPPDLAQASHIEGLPLGTRGGTLIRYNFPLDADYDFSVALIQNIVGYVTGLEYAHQLEISIDGKRVFLSPVGGEEDNKMSDANLGVAKDTLDARLKTRVHVTAGPHAVAVAFLRKDSAESDEPLQPFTRDLDLQNMNGIPLIDHVTVTGPFNSTGPGDTPSRRRILTCKPSNSSAELARTTEPRSAEPSRVPERLEGLAGPVRASDETQCAKQILSNLARKAYRGPVSDKDLETLLSFYQSGHNHSTFEYGIENGIRLILASPRFIFRAPSDPVSAAPGSVYRVSDLELASRLSFFLWSTVPDDQLLDLATKDKLHDPAVLAQQVKRMLADPKANALVTDFAAQWLYLRNVQSVSPNQDDFPNFDDNLRQAMRQETELFFQSIVREDRNVLDLLNADYTFVNDRLAKHYGIPNIYGSQFRRVAITDENRRGLLGQASILTVTSQPNRTSPVLRGKWIMENLMGTPPPAPPPNVPPLKENDEGAQAQSVRALMEAHRKNPPCSTCHAVLDPLGFSLENFDAIGEWRVKDSSGPVDASGQLADGTQVSGPQALRKALMKHPEQFVRTLVTKLMTYGLGRELEYYDMPSVRTVERDASASNYRFSSLILGIVKSEEFQMRKVQPASGTLAQAR